MAKKNTRSPVPLSAAEKRSLGRILRKARQFKAYYAARRGSKAPIK